MSGKKASSLGDIYIKFDKKIFKAISLKYDDDNSVYIIFQRGRDASKSLKGTKFTYHPDGKNWLSGTPRNASLGKKGIEEFLRRSADMLLAMGMTFSTKDKRIYTARSERGLPLNQINKVVELSYISLYDISTINSNAEMLALADDERKIAAATIVDVSTYKSLTIRFYLVPDHLLQSALKEVRTKGLDAYSFKHPAYDLHIVTTLEDRWTGG